MPLDIKNIDKEAGLPEGIEFRKELVWEKIQTRKKSKLRLFWPWMVAAMVILGFGLSFLKNSKPVEVTGQEIELISKWQSEDLPIVQNQEIPIEEPEIILENPSLTLVEKEEIKPRSKSGIETQLEVTFFRSSILDSAKSIGLASMEPLNLQVSVDKPLSPAASRLQKTLDRMNKGQKIEETLIVEKFNLRKELNDRAVQATSKSNASPALNQLFKNRNENY